MEIIPGFLSEGGELGELTRHFDWSSTSIGAPDTWPQNLRLTVSMILKSKFPMFLWWGDDLIQFYNDAYRPSLGNNGKHPLALGQKGKDCWPEIWPIISPLMDQVRTQSKATWSEDQLIPIYRNGTLENVYWTFGYSPIEDESGKVEGILVVCTETTEKVLALKKLQEEIKSQQRARQEIEESEKRFRTMAEGTAILVAVSDETSGATYFNKAWTDFTGRSSKELLAFGWADVIHEDDRQKFMDLYLQAFKTTKPWESEFRALNGEGEYRWLLAKGLPRLRPDGSFAGYISSSIDITEKVNAERMLRAREQELQSVILQAPIGICLLDAKTLVSEIANESFIEVAGKAYEEIVGKYYWDSFAEAKPYFESALKSVVENGTTYYANEVSLPLIRHGKEEIVFVTFVYAPLLDTDGSVRKVVVWVLENTKQVLSRLKVEESEQEIRALIEAAPFPIGVYRGREMRVAFANESIMNIWGKGPDVIGKLFSEVLPELDNQAVFEQLDQVFNTGIAYHAKSQRLDLIVDGKNRPYFFNYSLTPLFDAKGTIYGVMNTGVDLTELTLAKRKVEENERNLKNTILQAPVAMCIFRGPEYVVEIANDRMVELWGKKASEVLNKPIFEGLPEVKAQGFEELLDNVFKTGVTFSAADVPIKLPRNGKIENLFVNFVYEAFREADDSISGIFAIAVDSTQQVLSRKKIEEVVAERTKELATANAELLHSNEELAQFAHIASHDLQEPVRKISTFAQMIEKNFGQTFDDKSKDYLEKIKLSATRMQSLIRDVLNYSELVKDGDVFSSVNLMEVVQNSKTDFELLIDQKRAVIQVAQLPAVEAIPLQMTQLFGNLLANALKFTRSDVTPVISIDYQLLDQGKEKSYSFLEPDRPYHLITFKDNGIGFKPEYAERIFNIFQRLHRKSDFEGTGIGLAMCKKIATNHHGFINALESSERGAVFNIFLPVHQRR